MKIRWKRVLTLALACCLLLSAVPASAQTAGFPDVAEDEWYSPYLTKVFELPGIINGIKDNDGVFRFHPTDHVKRGEFLKMVICAAQLIVSMYTTDKSRDNIHWAGKYYTLAMEDNLLVPDAFASGGGVQVLFECTWNELEQPISRYEMAVIINNICANTLMEKTVIATNAAQKIQDYAAIGASYTTAVEQAYGKGILTGYEDTSFRGEETLTRAQAVTVIERMLWDGDRNMPGWAEEQPISVTTVTRPANFVSFAEWLHNGHVDAYGKPDREARILLFGNENKTYFSSAAEASAFMQVVTVPIWTVDKAGNKLASTATLSVHYLVAQEVRLIFQQIYDDPEQFPIYGGWSVGGARFSDTLRHSWGCAIDINPYNNCECTINWNTMANRVTCGYGWWPMGHADASFAGSMTGQSQYSIGSQPGEYGYSVVKAFKDYGWGWGGQGYSLKSTGNQKYDFMHFSVLSSGG